MNSVEVEHRARPWTIKRETLDRLQGIIFDVDGTLYDQSALRWRIFTRIAASHRNSPTDGIRVIRTIQAYRKAHERLRGRAFSPSLQLESAAAECGFPVSEVRITVDKWFERVPLDLLPRCVYTEIPEFLSLLSELRIRCGVFSDYPAEAKLSAMGLNRFFTHVLSAKDVGRQKPDPTGITAVARDMGLAPERTLYFGDRIIDMEAAANAGMPGVLIRGGDDYAILNNQFTIRKRQRESS
jgi:HAD superfamily hydrolase (TIGR01509 family)